MIFTLPPHRVRRPSPALRALAAVLALGLAAALLPAPAADAGGFARFQHGGRGVAQAGAFVARADSPFALSYNPAGITEVEGLQVEAGLDFSNATDEYTRGGDTFRADHSIQFPPAFYLTWSDSERLGDWALGLGIDTPVWYRADWDPVFFPRRFATRLNELEVYEVHPVVAYRLSPAWSFGGGLRYLSGTTTWGRNELIELEAAGQVLNAENLVDAEADVDGFGADVGVQYRSTLWGFGAHYRSEVELEGSDRLSLALRDVPAPDLTDEAQAVLDARARGFDVRVNRPAELTTGIWFAPYPELRFEIDAAYTLWSDAEQTFTGAFLSLQPNVYRRFPVDLHRDWDDTVSVRLGLEGDVSDFFALSGGVAWEPSPVPSGNVGPAWPRGDLLVYALGASFDYERVRFDLGYSFHDHDDRTGTQGAAFTADEQVWSVSANYRF